MITNDRFEADGAAHYSVLSTGCRARSRSGKAIPVVELNRYIIDVPNAAPWTCVTDAEGNATEIVERRTG